ncbi:hypothetical protein FLX27_25985 [Agrobacterium tumefaciens]|nr:hypothetical protein FLX27_25985 [Agrobacterium tumefaciens]
MKTGRTPAPSNESDRKKAETVIPAFAAASWTAEYSAAFRRKLIRRSLPAADGRTPDFCPRLAIDNQSIKTIGGLSVDAVILYDKITYPANIISRRRFKIDED